MTTTTTINSTLPADLEAASIIAAIHDGLVAAGLNEDACAWWLSRFIFCVAGEDAGIFPRGSVRAVLKHAFPDGSDAGNLLGEMFDTLGIPEKKRPYRIPPHLRILPYLPVWFTDPAPRPVLDSVTLLRLRAAVSFNWSDIDPVVLGAIIQTVDDPAARRQLGANYTTRANVLKVVGPVVLDDFLAEYNDTDAFDEEPLVALLDRLGSTPVFDPAAGCGNFLATTYRGMSDIQNRAYGRLIEINPVKWKPYVASNREAIRVRPGNFHGVELSWFPFHISEMVMALMVHKMDRQFAERFGSKYDPHIQPPTADLRLGNALRMDWRGIVPPSDNLRIIGNPPFANMGQKMTASQLEDRDRIWFGIDGAGDLDLAACWFLLTQQVIAGTEGRAGFIATSSLFQGSQAQVFGRVMDARGMRIDDAWKPFEWDNPAPGVTSVHVVAVNFSDGKSLAPDAAGPVLHFPDRPDRPDRPKHITWNLIGTSGRDVIVKSSKEPLSPQLSKLRSGVDFADGSGAKNGGPKNAGLIMDAKGYAEATADPVVRGYIRKLMGGRELARDLPRWVLWLYGASPADLKNQIIARRVENTARARAGMSDPKKRAAAVPGKSHLPFVGLPYGAMDGEVLVLGNAGTGKNRRYLLAEFISLAETIPSSTVHVAYRWTMLDFGVMSSRHCRLWVDSIGGRQRDDPRVGSEGAWNTFPLPHLEFGRVAAVEAAARKVRAARPPGSGPLKNLYDPGRMPPALLVAHEQLDAVMDAVFELDSHDDDDRVARMLERYNIRTAQPTLPF